MYAPVYAPQTLPMPDVAWATREVTRPGFAAPLTAADLAADPQRALLRGGPADNIAAAIVDAEEEQRAEMSDDRQGAAAAAAAREARAPWDVGMQYVHPAMPRDVSTGPGAWTWPDPDIVPHAADEDLSRRAASAPYHPFSPMASPMRMMAAPMRTHTGACPGCAQAPTRCACATQSTQADAATAFMVSSHAPGRGPSTTAGAARAYNWNVGKTAHARAGGWGAAASRAMRTGAPLPEATAVYDTTDPAIYGAYATGPQPAYDTPYAPVGQLGVANRYGLHKLPGTINTTDVLVRRDAAAQGVADPYATGVDASARLPYTDALGFRYADRPQFGFAVPKFFPARADDAMLYETAAQFAPDMAADLADMVAAHSIIEGIEPLSARWAHVQLAAESMSHQRDPTMRPRTGPSVLHPGKMAQPPAWYRPPPS